VFRGAHRPAVNAGLGGKPRHGGKTSKTTTVQTLSPANPLVITTFAAFLAILLKSKKPCVKVGFVSFAGDYRAPFAAANRFCKLRNFKHEGCVLPPGHLRHHTSRHRLALVEPAVACG
jgi:hypothetical protein